MKKFSFDQIKAAASHQHPSFKTTLSDGREVEVEVWSSEPVNPTYTSINIANFCHKETAERVRDQLRAELTHCYLQPLEIGAAPAGGSFDLYACTGYEFGPECDPEKELMGFFAHVLAQMLAEGSK